MTDLSNETYNDRVIRIKKILMENPGDYLKHFEIGSFCPSLFDELLEKDLFCFAKAWAPFTAVNNILDKSTMAGLKNKLSIIIWRNEKKYPDRIIFELLDAYPIMLDKAYIAMHSDIIKKICEAEINS